MTPRPRIRSHLWGINFAILSIAGCILSIAGCDATRTSTHTLTVALEGKDGASAQGVSISMKETWESWKTWDPRINDGDETIYRRRWEGEVVPWLKGVTNSKGLATITMTRTVLDPGDGTQPLDTVSNREYVIKLQGTETEEELRLVMLPGAVVDGKSFRLTVVEIGKPEWILPQETPKRSGLNGTSSR